MEKWIKRSVELITSLAFGSDGSPSVIPYYPQKTRVTAFEERKFSRTVPEKYGISSKRIYNMLCELESERRANIHSVLVLCGGEVVCECSRDGYDVNLWHLSHSMSKTVSGMAVGLLVDDGVLDVSTRLVDIFPEIPYKDKRFASITVEHLLTMTAGVAFSEAGAVTEEDWTEAFFRSSVRFTPGTKFAYNSMNSYILVRIVDRLCGKSFREFIAERLFIPMGITNYLWERGPEGVEKGGWGLYLSAESWAKLGMMMLSGGVFDGVRILSEEWVRESVRTKAVAPAVDGDFNYGYQLWVNRYGDDFLFNGMFGQNVWVCPRNNIVAVVTGGNNELFQDSPAMIIIRKHLGGEMRDEIHRNDIKVLHERETYFFDCRRWVRPREKRHGFLYWLGFRSRTVFDTQWTPVLGTYRFAKNKIGALPLIVRAMQNNLDSSFEEMSLLRDGDDLLLSFTESGVNYRVPVGLYGYKSSVLDFRGEKYLVRAMGEALVGPRGECEYRIELLLPELPNTRMITIKEVSGEGISVRFSEVPNNKLIEIAMERVSDIVPALDFVVDIIERRYGESFIEKKIEETFAPTVIGADITLPGYDKTLDRERRRAGERSGAVKLILAVVDRFFRERDEPENTPSTPNSEVKKKSVISELLNRVSGKLQNKKTQ